MRIALRTGAGRGAYELAGTQGSYTASSLFDKEMFYELTPSLIVPGYTVPSLRQGKPRINIDDWARPYATHLYRWLAALLLLPSPVREFRNTAGNTLVADKAYSMTAIKIDVVAIELDRSVVRPTEILLETFGGFRQSLNFINRMSRLMRIWTAADSSNNSPLTELLRQHRDAVQAQSMDHKKIERLAINIFRYLQTIYDPLQYIESVLGIDQGLGTEELVPITEATEFGVDDAIPPELARIEAVRKWRKVAARDASAQQFRIEVKSYYRDTCLFTGQKLPKLKVIASSGVDAAHILPWASYGINSVSNGICLSKQSHWAFDSGVIKFSFDRSVNQYVISIPDVVSIEARQMDFSLDAYSRMVGPIPRERLPANTNLWPDPDYIDAYNESMFV